MYPPIFFIIMLASLDMACAKSLNEIIAERQTAPQDQGGGPAPTPSGGSSMHENMRDRMKALELPKAALEEKLTEALKEHIPHDFSVQLGQMPLLTHCAKQLLHPEVVSVSLNDQQTHFTSEVVACEGQKPVVVTGKIEALLEVPVLNRVVHFGDLITESDITSLKVPQRLVSKQMVTRVSDVIGCQPRCAILKMNTPLQMRDLERPFDVRKDSAVTISFVRPKMHIILKGKALENGRRGDSIKVLNEESKKTIRATVEGAGHVFVPAPLYPINMETESEDEWVDNKAKP